VQGFRILFSCDSTCDIDVALDPLVSSDERSRSIRLGKSRVWCPASSPGTKRAPANSDKSSTNIGNIAVSTSSICRRSVVWRRRSRIRLPSALRPCTRLSMSNSKLSQAENYTKIAGVSDCPKLRGRDEEPNLMGRESNRDRLQIQWSPKSSSGFPPGSALHRPRCGASGETRRAA
jgi:hypothetical protein